MRDSDIVGMLKALKSEGKQIEVCRISYDFGRVGRPSYGQKVPWCGGDPRQCPEVPVILERGLSPPINSCPSVLPSAHCSSCHTFMSVIPQQQKLLKKLKLLFLSHTIFQEVKIIYFHK